MPGDLTPQELAPLLHAACRRAYMAQVPGMPCPAWDEMPVTHGPRVAVAVQAGWLAAAREALARLGGGQEAGEQQARGPLPHRPVPWPEVPSDVRPQTFACSRCNAPLACHARGVWLIWTSEADGESCPGAPSARAGLGGGIDNEQAHAQWHADLDKRFAALGEWQVHPRPQG